MGFTRAEFMRILPAALHDYPYTLHDDVIQIDVAGQVLLIRIGEQQMRRVALLALPYLPVTFDYAQVDEVSFKTFLKQFDLYYRKGGG